jgi:hypothetical protein
VETDWSTVDDLIHELGAVRAFMDEAEALPETAEAPQVADVRLAMTQATDAVSHVLSEYDRAVVEAAWHAIAQAQDAVVKARVAITTIRSAREAAHKMAELARAQRGRAHEQAQAIAEKGRRTLRGLAPITDVRGPHEN